MAFEITLPFLFSYGESKTIISPSDTYFSASSLSFAPISIQRLSFEGTFFLSSALSKWVGLAFTTPDILFFPTLTCLANTAVSLIPPTSANFSVPSDFISVTINPTSSMCAESNNFFFGISLPFLNTSTLPILSTVILSA